MPNEIQTTGSVESELQSSSLDALGRVLRAENKALREQILHHNRVIAALVMQAGEEVRVDDRTIALLPVDAEIVIWSEPAERATVVRVRTPKHPTEAK